MKVFVGHRRKETDAQVNTQRWMNEHADDEANGESLRCSGIPLKMERTCDCLG
ncbi:MAG TPA: hypothetical protein VGH98_05680 [Gemmatimonadaceae bacterium]|jgi:hypothetical protein